MILLAAPNVHELYADIDAALTAAQARFGRHIVPLLHENGAYTIFPTLAALWAATGDEAYAEHAAPPVAYIFPIPELTE